MSFFTALKFLTIFPAPAPGKNERVQIGRSLPFFPVVGLIISLMLAVFSYALHLIFPAELTCALLVAALAIMTGAHHLDGLIDTFDAMVAGRSREQRLAIMSDTGAGAFGITALCLTLLIKYAAILGISSLSMIILFPVLSRWSLGAAILIFPAAKSEGMGFAAKNTASWTGFVLATLVSLPLAICFLGLIGGAVVMILLLVLVCCLGLFLGRLYGGLTGDCYGAIVEIGEVIALLLIIAITHLFQFTPGSDFLKIPLPVG